MNPQIAEQLLYESEATLRLVDTLLDELQVMEPHLSHVGRVAHGLRLEEETIEEPSELPEQLESAANQARAVLDALAQSRDVLERISLDKRGGRSDELGEAPSAIEVREGLERVLLLVDRLDEEREPAAVRGLLRAEILEMLAGVRAQEITEQQLGFASSVLNDTQSRLSALVQCLSPRQGAVIQFPGSWAQD
jgi:hypothetical protein